MRTDLKSTIEDTIARYAAGERQTWDLYRASKDALLLLERLEEEQDIPPEIVSELERTVRSFETVLNS
jgi:hypothetical protein